MWKEENFVKIGERNKKCGLVCQDSVASSYNGKTLSIALADGSGTTNLASEGAKCAAETLSDFLTNFYDDLYDMEKSQLQFNVIINVRTALYELCNQYKEDIKSFHSTLLGIAINEEKGTFIGIHLGDGKIGVCKNDKIRTISYPENGVNTTKTYLTSSGNIGEHMRILRGNIGDISEFILMSDGWDRKENPKKESIPLKEVFQNADKKTYTDDISYIALLQS